MYTRAKNNVCHNPSRIISGIALSVGMNRIEPANTFSGGRVLRDLSEDPT
jgi:hypothetical protein